MRGAGGDTGACEIFRSWGRVGGCLNSISAMEMLVKKEIVCYVLNVLKPTKIN